MELDFEEEEETWSKPIASFAQTSTQNPRGKQQTGSKERGVVPFVILMKYD
jgi:hypothetical protein